MGKICVVPLCTVLALALAAPAGIATAKKGGETKVVCLDQQTLEREYKVTPKHCIFHRRGAPKVEAFFVRTKRDRWHLWSRERARGRGTQAPSMGPSTPVKIRLKDPVRRCGHRAYSKAHFFYPKAG